jgi:hypothetical protein
MQQRVFVCLSEKLPARHLLDEWHRDFVHSEIYVTNDYVQKLAWVKTLKHVR